MVVHAHNFSYSRRMEEAGFQSEVSPRHNLKALYKK
jgi:hypothetical protein